MCTGNNNPYQRSVFWDEDGSLVYFKFPLPSGTKQENVKVEIDEDGNLSMVISSHTDDPVSSSPSSSMIIPGFSFLFFLKIKAGDASSPTIPMKFKFKMPVGLNTNGFKTAVDDEGLLTLTFQKLVPIHSEKWETSAKDTNKRVLHFKAYLPAGKKLEDIIVGIEGRKSLVIGFCVQPKKEEGDTSIIPKQFHGKSFALPDGVNPEDGFKTAMDDAGLLTVTFTKLKPRKKKLGPIAKKMLGCLAHAVPAACVLICDEVSDAI